MKNIFIQAKLILRLTFNPGLNRVNVLRLSNNPALFHSEFREEGKYRVKIFCQETDRLRQVDLRRVLVLTVLMNQRGNTENDACNSLLQGNMTMNK